MRGPIRKALLAQVAREFEQRFSRFKRIEPESDSPIWMWDFAPNLKFFVMLQPFERKDQFAVEVGWSDSADFPWRDLGDLSHIAEPRLRSRLSWLWARGNESPVWDLAPEKTAAIEGDLEAVRRGESQAYPPDPPVEQILSRVGPAVDDAIHKLVQYGLPLFRRVAEQRGIKLPLPDNGSSADSSGAGKPQ